MKNNGSFGAVGMTEIQPLNDTCAAPCGVPSIPLNAAIGRAERQCLGLVEQREARYARRRLRQRVEACRTKDAGHGVGDPRDERICRIEDDE